MRSNTEPLALEPFRISVPAAELDDLRARLRATRWPSNRDNSDWSYGVDGDYLRELVDYWIDGFDWAAAEATINAHEQHRVEVDGVPVHFLRQPGVGPAPIPLIMTHGWPWTFWHWSRVIGPLADPAAHGGDPADAFEVIVPSLPGFGFSTPLLRPDINFWKTADIWHRLMTDVLGHGRYAATASDMGAFVTGQLGHKYADQLYGIHLGSPFPLDWFSGERPWDFTGGQMVPDDASDELRAEILSWVAARESHFAVHVLDPQTQAVGLNDSPAGMLAWILERWRAWSDNDGDVEDVFSKDDMLTHATIFWVTQAIGTSMRMYANAARYPWQPSHDRTPPIQAPTGFTLLGGDNPPGVSTSDRLRVFLESPRSAWWNIVYAKVHEHGGHFGPWENPQAFIGDIRATFRPLR